MAFLSDDHLSVALSDSYVLRVNRITRSICFELLFPFLINVLYIQFTVGNVGMVSLPKRWTLVGSFYVCCCYIVSSCELLHSSIGIGLGSRDVLGVKRVISLLYG